jgi:hypothetical protein
VNEADTILIAAQREVDAMLPDSPPIAPPVPVVVRQADIDALACHGIKYDERTDEFILRDSRRIPNTVVDYAGWGALFATNDVPGQPKPERVSR